MSTPFYLVLPRPLFDEMIAQAREEFPNECCGLLGGKVVEIPGVALRAQVQGRFPLVNELASPIEYFSESRSMFEATRAIDHQGLELLAVYHSHPTSDPIPSRKDCERNYSPLVMNLIISLKTPEPVVRAWWLTGEDYHEGEWRLSD